MLETETEGSLRLAGLYRHKETGVEVELGVQPTLGTPLINAYIRSGFEYVGPVKKPLVETEVVSPKIETKEK